MLELFQFTKAITYIWIPILVTTGAILNLLTIMVFCRRKMRKYCVSLSMIFLAIFDTTVLTIPVLLTWIDEIFFKFYYLNNTIWCNLHGYADLISCANSSWIIILISVERWFAVCRPWEKQKKFTNKRVASTIIFMFLLSTIFFSYFPISIRVQEIKSSIDLNHTLIYTCQIYFENVYSIFGIISVLLVYVIPFFVLAFLNLMIIIKLRLRPFTTTSINLKRRNEKSISTSRTDDQVYQGSSCQVTEYSMTQANDSSVISTQSFQFNYSKNDRNLSITLVTVAFTFMILTFPYQAYWFYETFYLQFTESNNNQANTNNNNELSNKHFSNIEKYFKDITFLIKNMNYLINFFLYSALSKLFREEFLALLSDDKFILFNKCFRCFYSNKTKKNFNQEMNSNFNINNNNKSNKNSSSIAELTFSLEAFKILKNKNLKKRNQKLFQIRIEPSNFLAYFRNKKLDIKPNENLSKINYYETEPKRAVSNEKKSELVNDDYIENIPSSVSGYNKTSRSSKSDQNKCYKTSSTQTIRTTIKQYKSNDKFSKPSNDTFDLSQDEVCLPNLFVMNSFKDSYPPSTLYKSTFII